MLNGMDKRTVFSSFGSRAFRFVAHLTRSALTDYWLMKSDVRKPIFYAMTVGMLLLWRVGLWLLRPEENLLPASSAELRVEEKA